VVEVFADVSCPYAHVGISRFVRRRSALARPDLLLHVRAWPLELVNGQPLDGEHVGAAIDDLRRQVSPTLFRGFDPDQFPSTTLPALDLVTDAYEVGLVTGERASLAVRDALFEHGQDVSDAAVLARLRTDLGLGSVRPDSRGEVLADRADGQRRGVVGSPHFFVDETDFFCPSLDIHREGHDLHIHPDVEGFNRFFDQCTAA
jgi:2-hydroxychromene-2-carboxylate isomerase